MKLTVFLASGRYFRTFLHPYFALMSAIVSVSVLRPLSELVQNGPIVIPRDDAPLTGEPATRFSIRDVDYEHSTAPEDSIDILAGM